MIITALLYHVIIKRILMDQVNSANVLYSYIAQALGITHSMLKSYNDMLVRSLGM